MVHILGLAPRNEPKLRGAHSDRLLPNEVRTPLSSNRIARVIFCKHGAALVALNGFIKKSRTTPKAEHEARGEQNEGR